MAKKTAAIAPLVALAICSCAKSSADGKNSAVVTNWNVQTFFDAKTDGCEYKEFASPKWSESAYKERLSRLCRALKAMDSDIFVLEEIENEGILYDISNALLGGGWNARKSWSEGCFAKNAGDSIGCAALSRVPLESLTVHRLDIRTEGRQPQMRPIMRVVAVERGKPLAIFVNHWKSKSGGKEKSEIWRDWQESLLSSLFARETGAAMASGDFNRDLFDFSSDDEWNTVNLRASPFGGEAQSVRCAWLLGGEAAKPGSYFFRGEWERIDHIFANALVSMESFKAESSGEWAGAGGEPLRYAVYNGRGWADHLPVTAALSW